MIWVDHFNLLSIMTPRNLVSVTSAIWFPFIAMTSIHQNEFLGMKSMKLSFQWSVIIHLHSPKHTFAISLFIWWLRSLRFLPEQNKLVSSAKTIGMRSLDTLGRSFINTRKRKGQRMEP